MIIERLNHDDISSGLTSVDVETTVRKGANLLWQKQTIVNYLHIYAIRRVFSQLSLAF